ncbi:MAG: nitrilase-related carbon-nitrogen hydrolase [Anaerolineaceae bacterium]
MRVGFLQFQPLRGDVNQNIDAIQSLLAGKEFELLVLPELSNSGYLYDSREELAGSSEPADGSGPFLSALISLARRHHACLVSGFSESTANGLYNSAVAVDENGVLAHYRKIHLFNTEKNLFLPGDLGFKVFPYKDTQIGVMICFDWVFPESTRTLALRGAQIVCHPANLVLPYCQAAMVTRSLENGIFTITANRIGAETGQGQSLQFTGHSQVLSNKGQLLRQADESQTCLSMVEIEPKDALTKLFSPQNDLFQDRRPEFYQLR